MDFNNTEKIKKYALVAAGFIALAASIWYINQEDEEIQKGIEESIMRRKSIDQDEIRAMKKSEEGKKEAEGIQMTKQDEEEAKVPQDEDQPGVARKGAQNSRSAPDAARGLTIANEDSLTRRETLQQTYLSVEVPSNIEQPEADIKVLFDPHWHRPFTTEELNQPFNCDFEFTIAAPSKALITGGYLVIDPKFQGIVISLDSYFYVKVKCTKNRSGAEEPTQIIVRCPQIGYDSSKFVDNNMINSYLKFFLALMPLKNGVFSQVDFELYGDLSFYSQRDNLGENFDYDELKKQKLDPQQIQDISKKTGLGSSSAMTVGFTSAWFMVSAFTNIPLTVGVLEQIDVEFMSEQNLEMIHLICQISNAFIQNKIGSGFDIACAIYGSQVYRRFTNKTLIMELVDFIKSAKTFDQNKIISKLIEIRETFDYEFEGFTLPNNIQINMVDVNSGSDTKVLVSKVLEWEKSQSQRQMASVMFSGPLFQSLNKYYVQVQEVLSKDELALDEGVVINEYRYEPKVQRDELDSQKSEGEEQEEPAEVVDDGARLKVLCEKNLEYQNAISSTSGSNFCTDENQMTCSEILQANNEVVYVGLPGAGGDDAIFVLSVTGESQEATSQALQQYLSENFVDTKMAVLPVSEVKKQKELTVLKLSHRLLM